MFIKVILYLLTIFHLDTWFDISSINAPSKRSHHTAIWTGSKIIIWGGTKPLNPGCEYLKSGKIYNVLTDTWSSLHANPAIEKRAYHSAIWTGNTGNPATSNRQYLKTQEFILVLIVKKIETVMKVHTS